MKILITGNKGQLGRDATEILTRSSEVLAVDIEELDIGNARQVEGVVRAFDPDFIVNCAAYTQVDACETDRDAAWKGNVDGPKNLARSASACGGRLIHVSTDYVFDGEKPLPEAYTEADEPMPSSYYGRTKLEGEQAVARAGAHHMVVRTAWLYGATGKNFLKTMLRLAVTQPEKQITVVNDQVGSPTWSYQLALQIEKLIELNGSGIYHATAEGYCSWYDFARYFLDGMHVPHRVVPCTTDAYPTPAKRPKNSILENRRLNQAGANLMTDWRHGVDQFVHRFRDRLLAEVKKEI